MEQKVIETINQNKLIEDGDNILLAVSGGPDSISMLHILSKIKHINFKYSVAHVNHMIRKEAKEDENFVKKICQDMGINFYSKSIDIIEFAHTNKMGIEETGRYVRYQFFNETAEKIGANKIAIAHNKNDKIETIVMNILRGTGISGLKGIEPIKDKYIRPLLNCTRTEIEKYCSENNLNPRIDKTNFDNIYTRNKIRNIVIPYIQKEFNPNIIQTLERLSELVKEEEQYILKIVIQTYFQILVKEVYDKKTYIILDLKKFNKQDKVIKSRIILYTITKLLGHCKGIEKIHIEDIIKLCSKNIGNKYLTPNKNIKILIKNGQIHFIDQR